MSKKQKQIVKAAEVRIDEGSLFARIAGGGIGTKKAESLSHTSVGQGTESRRPTKQGREKSRLKALHIRKPMMCKAYSLDGMVRTIRRALPYASMCKGFALMVRSSVFFTFRIARSRATIL